MQIVEKALKPLAFNIADNVSEAAGHHKVVATCAIPAAYQGRKVIAWAHVCGGGASGSETQYWCRWNASGLGNEERASCSIAGGRWAFTVSDVFTLPASVTFGFRFEGTSWTTSNTALMGHPIITFTVID